MTTIFCTPEWMIQSALNIAVIGAGGTGSEMLDGIGRMEMALRSLGHPGFSVTVWDGEEVSETNLLRQRFLRADLGQNKALTLAQRFNAFLGTSWRAIPERFDPASSEHPFHTTRRVEAGLIVTCTDSAQARVSIGKASRFGAMSRCLWVDTGNAASSGQVVLGHCGSQPAGALRLPTVLDLFPELEIDAATMDDSGPSCGAEEALTSQEFPVNRQVAATTLSLLWRMLRHGSVTYHGAFVDVNDNRVTPMPIDPAFWASMGYAGNL